MKTKEAWLDEMELRLKRVLLDLMDSSEEERQRILEQQITSHLEDVSGDHVRYDYLRSLRERFPQLFMVEEATPAFVPSLEPAAEVETVVKTIREVVPPTLEEAFDLVKRDWDKIDPSTKQEFAELYFPEIVQSAESDPLAKGGVDEESSERPPELYQKTATEDSVRPVANSAVGGEFADPSAEFARFLKLPEEASVSTDRLQTVLVSLLKTVAQVDSLGTQVYKQVGLSRDLKLEDLRSLVGAFVSNQSDDAVALTQSLDEARTKVGLVISSIANLPQAFSQTHMAKFQPSAIEMTVGGGGGLLAGKDAKCWKRYTAMAEDIDPQKIEKAINDLMIKQMKKIRKR